MLTEKEKQGKVRELFNTAVNTNGNKKFETRRQASKYLNRYGKVWKQEHNIDLSAPKRG